MLFALFFGVENTQKLAEIINKAAEKIVDHSAEIAQELDEGLDVRVIGIQRSRSC